jgi:hypothetical protein
MLAKLPFKQSSARENMSDFVALEGGGLAAVSDEGSELALVDPARGESRLIDAAEAFGACWSGSGAKAPKELDLEAVARSGHRLFVTGSASLKRKKPKDGEDNAARLATVIPAAGEGADHANYLFTLAVNGVGAHTELSFERCLDVRSLLLGLPVLAPFAGIPSKENGLDVEGLAADEHALFFGLRGPVLRGHALVVRTDHAGQQPQLFFLDLAGRGIRGLAPRPAGGLWLLAGPTMEDAAPFSLYAWDGSSSVFSDEPAAALTLLRELPSGESGSPEGLALVGNQLCVLFDGPKGGAPSCMPAP